MARYSLEACEKVIERYIVSYNGEMFTVEEGSLGLGTVVLVAPGKKTTVITEVYWNSQSSVHKIRQYNKMPKKYEQKLNKMS